MRIRIFSITLVLFLTTFIASAQRDYKPIQTGPRITLDALFLGETFLTIQDDLGIDSLSLSTQRNEMNFGLGMFMQINLKDYLFIRPEAIIHISNRHMDLETIGSSTTESLTHRLYSFSLPLQLGYRVEGISLQAGMVWHSQLRTDLVKTEKEKFDFEFGNGYTSFTAGIGYQSNWFLIDLYYEKALGSSEDMITINDVREYKFNYSPQHLSLRIGFILAGRN